MSTTVDTKTNELWFFEETDEQGTYYMLKQAFRDIITGKLTWVPVSTSGGRSIPIFRETKPIPFLEPSGRPWPPV